MAGAQKMQQLVAQASTQVSTVFGKLPTEGGEEAVTQIVVATEPIMQEWQKVVISFQELKVTALAKVPELGPLFEKTEEGQLAEQEMGTRGAMEVETVICN